MLKTAFVHLVRCHEDNNILRKATPPQFVFDCEFCTGDHATLGALLTHVEDAHGYPPAAYATDYPNCARPVRRRSDKVAIASKEQHFWVDKSHDHRTPEIGLVEGEDRDAKVNDRDPQDINEDDDYVDDAQICSDKMWDQNTCDDDEDP